MRLDHSRHHDIIVIGQVAEVILAYAASARFDEKAMYRMVLSDNDFALHARQLVGRNVDEEALMLQPGMAGAAAVGCGHIVAINPVFVQQVDAEQQRRVARCAFGIVVASQPRAFELMPPDRIQGGAEAAAAGMNRFHIDDDTHPLQYELIIPVPMEACQWMESPHSSSLRY